MKRIAFSSLFTLALAVALCAPASCQTLPGNWRADFSVRAEYLFGRQQFREVNPDPRSVWQPDRLRFDYNPGLWVISGLSEVSPSPRTFIRFAASTSVPSSPRNQAQVMFTPPERPNLGGVWAVETGFTSWEAAGGYHFADDGLYRLSLGAGYCQQWWRHAGTAGSDRLKDTFTSNIPFLFLGAALYLPGWSGHFELLGSPYMNKIISCNAVRGTSYANYLYNGRGAGRVELRVCGKGSITKRLLWGLTAKYMFEGLSGPTEGGVDGVNQGPYNGYFEESMGQVGFHLTWIM